MNTYNVLSWGGGVQSSFLLLASARGLFPRIDAAIFCDPGLESRETMDSMRKVAEIAENAGIRVIFHKRVDFQTDLARGWIRAPYFVKKKSGGVGLNRRSCTKEYKVVAFDQCVKRQVMGLKPRQMVKGAVCNAWLGISSDERKRAIIGSGTYWKRVVYPLLQDTETMELLDKPWSRTDCIDWLREEFSGLHVPKSACIMCPYLRREAMIRLYRESPEEFAVAEAHDARIREINPILYVHRRCMPLREAVEADIADGIGDQCGDIFEGRFSCGTCGT